MTHTAHSMPPIPSVVEKKTDNKQPTWHFEVEGSGQRKRYLRSLKDKAVA